MELYLHASCMRSGIGSDVLYSAWCFRDGLHAMRLWRDVYIRRSPCCYVPTWYPTVVELRQKERTGTLLTHLTRTRESTWFEFRPGNKSSWYSSDTPCESITVLQSFTFIYHVSFDTKWPRQLIQHQSKQAGVCGNVLYLYSEGYTVRILPGYHLSWFNYSRRIPGHDFETDPDRLLSYPYLFTIYFHIMFDAVHLLQLKQCR